MLTILLVEDNLEDKILTVHTIHSNHRDEIYAVPDGQQAIDYVFGMGRYEDRQRVMLPDVILLDLRLPNLTGFEVLAALKADSRTKAIPVIVLTGSNIENDIERSMALGASGVLDKPLDFGKFTQLLKDLGLI